MNKTLRLKNKIRFPKRSILGTLLFCGFFSGFLPIANAQKKPSTADTVKKLEEDVATATQEIARLQSELETLQTEFANQQGESETLKENLREEISSLEETLSLAQDTVRLLEQNAKRASRLVFASEGKRTYRRHCAPCHGEDGDGEGVSAEFLDQTPRSFIQGTYKFRSTPSGTLPTDDDLARTIRIGIPGTAMPGWRDDLSPQEIDRLVALLQTFSERFEEENEEIETIPIPEAPKERKNWIKEGRVLYLTLGCDQCHGKQGRGDGPSKELKDEQDRPIFASDFSKGVYKSGYQAEDLYRTIVAGLDGTPMPSYNEVFALSRESIESISEGFSPKDAKLAKEYAALQPEEITEENDPIIERRRWALVAYLESLAKPRNFFHWLFKVPMRRYDLPPKRLTEERASTK